MQKQSLEECIYYGFNRTFMELKSNSQLLLPFKVKGFNRTFMELKLLSCLQQRAGLSSFNRTFMELK